MSSQHLEQSPPSATMATPSPSSPPTTVTSPETSILDPDSNSTSASLSPDVSNSTVTPGVAPEKIDYRTPTPPALNATSKCLSDLYLTLNLATKITVYITHRTSLFSNIFNLGKAKDDAALKRHFLNELKMFVEDGALDVKEFGKMFSCFATENKNRSKAFMMEVARCEGVKECVEYACCQDIIDSEKLLRDIIIEPLTHALAHRKVPQYLQLISETHEIHQKLAGAIKGSTMRLKELVELANKRLAAFPEGGEDWDDDYQTFALIKKAAREEFAKGLGM